MNAGDQIGIGESSENRTANKRTIAAAAYPLDGVTILSETLVKKVIISAENIATGVELADGQSISAKREVILSSGSFRTPQLLMLSGFGSATTLNRHGIRQLVDLPEVGRNLWDHLGSFRAWKLRHPELGAAQGSTTWTDPAFENGIPLDWWVNQTVPVEALRKTLELDNSGRVIDESHPLLRAPRSHLAFPIPYYGSHDGTLISSIGLNHLPTSRGSVTISSTDPAASPVIDHNHLDTQADRYRHRLLIRTMQKMMDSPAGQGMVVGEALPEGVKAITDDSTDDEVDARVRQCAL
jgi:choline dehydrogenase-like flavoprotein